MKKDNYTLFGIRHHGPGSAINLINAMERLNPDAVLIEGPPDADSLIHFAGHPDMKPPVAILVYDRNSPLQSVFYPFAEFSPEWQAMRFALERNIPVRFMDLPHTHRFTDTSTDISTDISSTRQQAQEAASPSSEDSINDAPPADDPDHTDPLDWFARHAGYEDGESWWEHAIEERLDSGELFMAIADIMAGLREQFPNSKSCHDEQLLEARREAWMRKVIRSTVKEGYRNIAVVCGAWHVPALSTDTGVRDDSNILKDLPKVKVDATWVPWTYSRLSRRSGYGAGVHYPGWYHHLWACRRNGTDIGGTSMTTRWLVAAAGYLRSADLDASSAHVIEAVRLAETLASLRQRPFPGIAELGDAILSVLCFGNKAPVSLIREPLMTGERMGQTAPETPKVPLQIELEKQIKSLRLTMSPTVKELDLDLRTPAGLSRSHLFHRLNLLGISWGKHIRTDSGKKGTFHEYWQIRWEPEFSVTVIEAAMWGTTVKSAASAKVVHDACHASTLAMLSEMVHQVIMAELPDATGPVVQELDAKCGQSHDVSGLMQALSSLVTVLRYGNVRQSDTAMLAHVVDGMITRICIGLRPACQSIDEDASREMARHISSVHHAVALTENEQYQSGWIHALNGLIQSDSVHALIRGKSCRLLFDKNAIAPEKTAQLMSLALSPGNEPDMAAAWIEGFLEGSGMILVHDRNLWAIIDDWLTSLSDERFIGLLPLVRRTFSTFPVPERNQLGMLAKKEPGNLTASSETPRVRTDHYNTAWGDRAAINAARLMGLLPIKDE